MTIKLSWQERVRDTEKFHREYCQKSKKHTIKDTARMLHRSYGSINEDLQLASWLKTHPKVAEFKSMVAAMVYVRERRQSMKER